MTRILLLGYTPPPLAGDVKIEAAHYRTWQFLAPLLDAGHQVYLVADEPDKSHSKAPLSGNWHKNLIYEPIPYGKPGWIKKLQNAHNRFQPDCIVAVNFSHCLYATKLRTHCPIWMDIYGDMLTIVQAALHRARSNRGLLTSIAFLREVLRRGDLFSVCGLPQKHATVGELAMVGRLNRHTFGYEFVQVILPGSPPANPSNGTPRRPRSFLPRFGIQDDHFVVLWCGGYNTWTDVETLFQGLESAMSQNASIHYVSVGANTYEAPDNVYQRFLNYIDNSPYKNRYHMLGWRPWSEIADFYRESDVGLNIDALHYETLYGTRTRLVEMIGAGLPVITTLGAELSYLLESQEAALTFSIGDAQGLAHRILQLANDPDLRIRLANNASRFSQNQLSFDKTTQALQEWVRSPTPAPDRFHLDPRERILELGHFLRSIARRALWHTLGKDK